MGKNQQQRSPGCIPCSCEARAKAEKDYQKSHNNKILFFYFTFVFCSNKIVGSGLTGLGERTWNKLRNWTLNAIFTLF